MAKIRNKVTGEVREIPDAQLGSYGLSAPTPTYSPPASPEPQPAPQGGGMMEGILGLLNPVEANSKLAGTMFQGAAKAGQDKSAKGNLPKAISNAFGNIGNVAKEIPGTALEDAQNIFGLRGAKVAGKLTGKGIQTGAQAARYPTKKLAANATEKAANEATASGVKGDWDTLSALIKSKTSTELGMNPEIKKALNSLITEKVPAHVENAFNEGAASAPNHIPSNKFGTTLLKEMFKTPEKSISPIDEFFSTSGKHSVSSNTPKMTPSELLQWRRQISARGAGGGVFANLFKGSNIDDKVNSIARSAISDYLHTVAPKTRTGDKLYSLYSKGGRFGGDPKQLLLKYGLGGGAAAIGAPTVGGMIKGYMNSNN